MEVFDITNNKTFTNSKNFNQVIIRKILHYSYFLKDGNPTAEKFNLWDGFKCSNGGQPDTNVATELTCSDYKVRYECLKERFLINIDVKIHIFF